jgi:uncharacterized protein (TIGR02996 family)
MDEHDAFLRAIRDNPEDDTPRLVFADWLQEHDEEERAQFIRLQCELATLDPRTSKAEELRERIWRLQNKHEPAWVGFEPLWDLVSVRFHRGFVHAVGKELEEMSAEMWNHLRRLWNTHPVQQVFMLRPGVEGLDSLIEEAAPRLNALHLRSAFLTPDRLTQLLRSFTRGRIRSLQLGSSNSLTDEHARIIAQAPELERLEELFLSTEPDLTDDAGEALAHSPYLTNLKHLDIAYASMGARGLSAILLSKNLPSLRYVNAEGNVDVGYNAELDGIIHDVRERIVVNIDDEDPECTRYYQEKMASRTGFDYPFYFSHW